MKVTIIDYGMGNLFSVQRAVEICGVTNITLGTTPDDIIGADCLILPGVGAFKDGMQGLKAAGLVEPIKAYSGSGKPLLGICLGAQMLATTGEEFGTHEGLDLISGRVTKIPAQAGEFTQKLPFIGWTPLSAPRTNGFADTALQRLNSEESVYLVHSFHLEVADSADLLATYDYGGVPVTAAIQRKNVTGMQFHPEKSSVVGLRILSDFLAQV
ncbi:MAG TPA: imidazole glycerol phosphate synthase subunit HisH [Roseobacter sp.]|uniref:Glutamine amidotransferase domain-containing protein n=1 Tax=marine sediment metagenome TaxID=412755 RepID=A0A0F9VQ36_9ZZZZ|nr:imidazole glycerol phosphate synthase subunit HisH [Roseobacter sp.]|tara:strand:- start:423 stop:1061 length:639 start_codon:yes stop_codon:yes gene_type:complete